MLTQTNDWISPPSNLILTKNKVHVWRATLKVTHSVLLRLESYLSRDELNRVARLHYKKDRDYFITARGILRSIISLYLKVPPSDISFSYNKSGKPMLMPQSSEYEIQFNLSHSNGLALFAFAKERKVGVDLERLSPEAVRNNVAEQFFTESEVTTLRSLPVNMQTEAFFNCWTRKEAFIKAKGDGVSLQLNQFDVSVKPHNPAQILTTRYEPSDACLWSLTDLKPAAGYTATLAVEGHDFQVKYLQFSFV